MTPAPTRNVALTRAQRKTLADIELLRDRDGLTRLSCREIAELTGIPKSTVAYSITRLNDLRLIFTQTGNSGRRTVHRLLSHAPLRSEPVQAKAVKV